MPIDSPSSSPASIVPGYELAGGYDRSRPVAPRPALPRRTVVLAAFAAWTAFAVFFTQVLYVYFPLNGQSRFTWWSIFVSVLATSWWWAACTLPVLSLARRFRFEWPRIWGAIAVHVSAAFAIHCGSSLIEWSMDPWLKMPRGSLLSALASGVMFDLLRYSVMVAGMQAFDLRVLYQGERSRAMQLRYELLEAELHMMRMQLQPHFLFNALHAISELIYRDARLADRALTKLADLLRLSLRSGVRQEVTLAEELEFLDAYLDLERIRAGDALNIQVEVDEDAYGDLVPNLILQPLVENALRHGVRGVADPCVRIEGRHRHGRLELTIEDNGRGLPIEGVVDGLGLRSTRARLRGLYGERQTLELRARSEGGTIVSITLPARPGAGVSDEPRTHLASGAE